MIYHLSVYRSDNRNCLTNFGRVGRCDVVRHDRTARRTPETHLWAPRRYFIDVTRSEGCAICHSDEVVETFVPVLFFFVTTLGEENVSGHLNDWHIDFASLLWMASEGNISLV